ncbi:hypothetical protein VDG1235_1924 [Verrucomicrobiia bacterium DG1235]|nr:hypothetical protein VDG1235_1924 [Verrucomicrobiae bacterium DG1235]
MRLTLYSFTLWLIALCLSCFAANLDARNKQRIVVQANATAEYEQRRAELADIPETYVISQGKYFAGGARDGSVSEQSFGNVVENLAKDLAERNYCPADGMESADLLIVVHWGTTIVQDDPEQDDLIRESYSLNPEADDYDDSEVRFAQMMDDTNRMSRAAQIRRNARLLGYSEALADEESKLVPTEKERTLKAQLDRDRYFVVLMAWDNRALLESKERKLLWSTRMSVQSVGTNFRESLPLLSIAAGEFFGRESDGLSTRVVKRGDYKVRMGELEVVEMTEEDRRLLESESEEE